MTIDIFANILSLLSLLVAVTTFFFGSRLTVRVGRKTTSRLETPSFREIMRRLSADLARASAEVDKTIEEMATVSRMREEAINALDSRLSELSAHEKELQTRVENLKSVPLPAVEYFLEATDKSEKRSAARDYILFGLGVVASTVVTIILKLVFNI